MCVKRDLYDIIYLYIYVYFLIHLSFKKNRNAKQKPIVADSFDIYMQVGVFFQLDRTALHWAAANGNIDVIEKLVEDGADLESKDKVPVLWVKS